MSPLELRVAVVCFAPGIGLFGWCNAEASLLKQRSKKPIVRARSTTGGVPPKTKRTLGSPQIVRRLGELAQ